MDCFFFVPGKRDDEMDPMDPSAYSDAPRYFIYTYLHYDTGEDGKLSVPLT